MTNHGDSTWFNTHTQDYPGDQPNFIEETPEKKPCLVVVSYPPGGQKLHFFWVFLGDHLWKFGLSHDAPEILCPERYLLDPIEKKTCPILSKNGLLILSHDFFYIFAGQIRWWTSPTNASSLAAICCCCCCSICPAFRDGQHLVFKSWQLYVQYPCLRLFSDSITQNGKMDHTQWICGINRLLLVVLKYKHVKQTHILP